MQSPKCTLELTCHDREHGLLFWGFALGDECLLSFLKVHSMIRVWSCRQRKREETPTLHQRQWWENSAVSFENRSRNQAKQSAALSYITLLSELCPNPASRANCSLQEGTQSLQSGVSGPSLAVSVTLCCSSWMKHADAAAHRLLQWRGKGVKGHTAQPVRSRSDAGYLHLQMLPDHSLGE